MRTPIVTGLCAGVLALAACGGDTENPGAARSTVRIAAEEPGGGWYSYGATFKRIIEEGSDGAVRVEIVPRGGGISNPLVVDRGRAEFGFATSNATAWAMDGLASVYGDQSAENLRGVVGGLQFAYTMVLARRAYVERTGLDTLDKALKAETPPRIGMEPTGSQVPVIADFMFKALGSSAADLRSQGRLTQVTSSQLAQLIRDGGIDYYVENVPAGQPTVTEVTLTNDMVFVPLSDPVIDALEGAGLPRGVMPDGVYDDQSGPYETGLSVTIFITNKDVPENLVYEVTKALVEGEETLRSEHAPLKVWDPAAGARTDEFGLELHPGAARYYRERGWIE